MLAIKQHSCQFLLAMLTICIKQTVRIHFAVCVHLNIKKCFNIMHPFFFIGGVCSLELTVIVSSEV